MGRDGIQILDGKQRLTAAMMFMRNKLPALGRLFREFSITLAAAMLLSLAVSLTLTPSLCARWLVRKPALAAT